MNALSFQNKYVNFSLTRSLFVVFCFSQPVFAEGQGVALDMISVVGQATSGLDTLVTTEDIEKTQADDLSDIFHHEPSVSVGGSVNMGQKIYVRNIGEDSLNITVDGAEQAGAVFHHSGRIAIEPELLKQVEVEAGSGSATAGPGALGGSIRFTTKDPQDLLDPEKNSGILLKDTYYSNGEGNKISASLFGRDKAGIYSGLLSVVGSEVENLEDGNGDTIIGSESKKSLGYLKMVANFTDEHYLSLSHEDLTEEGDILFRPERIVSARNVAEPTEGERRTTIVNYGFDAQDNDLLNITLNLYRTEQKQTRESRGVAFDGTVKTLGATLQNESHINNHSLTYGINYRDDKSVLNDVDFDPSYFEETGKVRGVYIQDVIEASERLTLSTGIRFDDYELKDVNGQQFKDSDFSPNISANYRLSPELSLSAGYAEALRGPEVKDSFKISTSSNDENLRAEKARNIELGLDFSRGYLTLAGGIYRSLIEDPIGGVTPFADIYENLEDDIETQGYFISASYQWDQLAITASFNHADTESGGDPVTRYVYSSTAASTGDTLVLDISYQFTNNFFAGWTSEYVRGIHDINIIVDGDDLRVDKPGYSTHDIYARWLPMGNDSVVLSLTIKNMFNKQYLSHGSLEDFSRNPGYEVISGSPEAGRDIRLSASVRF